MLQASSAAVSHVLGQTNAAGIGIMRQIHECSPVLACRGFQTSLFSYTLSTCTWLCPANCNQESLGKRKEGLLTSHLNKLGNSLTCLLQDCLNIPRLPEYSSLIVSVVDWKGDWQCYKHLLPQYHMSWDRPMLLG